MWRAEQPRQAFWGDEEGGESGTGPRYVSPARSWPRAAGSHVRCKDVRLWLFNHSPGLDISIKYTLRISGGRSSQIACSGAFVAALRRWENGGSKQLQPLCPPLMTWSIHAHFKACGHSRGRNGVISSEHVQSRAKQNPQPAKRLLYRMSMTSTLNASFPSPS